MPKPIVEIHQKILSPVAIPTDPEQSVAIVGLHCVDRSSVLLGQYQGIASEFVDGVQGTFDMVVDEPGVIINQDIDLGGHIIEGDLSCTLKNVKLAVGSKVSFTNFTAYGSPRSSREILLQSSFSGSVNTSVKDHFVTVTPVSSLRNVVKVSSGSGTLNLLTGATSGNPSISSSSVSSIANLALNSTLVKFSGSNLEFKVIGREADRLFVYGSTEAAEDFLHDNASDFTGLALSVKVDGSYVEVPGFLFDISEAEKQTAQIDSFDAITKVATLTSSIRFCSVGLDSREGSCVVSAASQSEIIISELDATNPLVVVSQASGDATFKIKKDRLFDEGVVSCDVYANYTVALTAYSDKLRDVNSVSVDLLGVASLSNQLCLAAKLALSNAGSTTVKVLSLDLTPEVGQSVPKTLTKAYLEALSIINSDPDVYAICPLTSDIQVITAYKNSAEAMSSPSKGKFRIVLGSSEGAPNVEFIVGTSKAPVITGVASNGSITDETKNFRASSTKVMEGDLIVVVDSAEAIKSGEVSSTTAVSLSVTWDNNSSPANGSCSYYVFRDISGLAGKTRQIELMASLAAQLSSNRLLLVFPGLCSISVDGVEYANVASFFLTSALAGLVAGLEAHRPKNNISLAGVTGLQGSNIGRFSEDEIDAISDAGYFVFVQDTATAAPYCVHQVMTKYGSNKSVQELTELSVVNNFDFVSRFFKRSVEPFVGTYNITSDTLGLIRASLDSAISTLRLRNRPQIGAPIINGAVELVRQASYDSGTVESRVSVVFPKVLNKIVLEIVSA